MVNLAGDPGSRGELRGLFELLRARRPWTSTDPRQASDRGTV